MTTMMRRLTLMVAMLALGLTGRELRGGPFTYSDFSSTAGLRLNGSATTTSNELELTPANDWQGGSAFTTAATSLGSLASFSTHFQFRITNSGGISDEDGAGADGLVFVVQTVSNSVGGSGAGIGYSGIGHSVGVEFDTYNNGTSAGDPSGNHVGIDLNGSMKSAAAQTEATRFNNGEIWNAWVDYNGATHELDVNWSMSNTRPGTVQLSYAVDLASILSQNNAYLGFTAGTGSAYNQQDVLNWEYVDSYSPIGVMSAPEPSSLISGGIASLIGLGAFYRRRRARPA